jgi:putative transposase
VIVETRTEPYLTVHEDSPLIKGLQIYHNYVRPHEALEGKTPAEACGINVEGQDKWLTLIQNASRVPPKQ